jgi:hypothetical protein
VITIVILEFVSADNCRFPAQPDANFLRGYAKQDIVVIDAVPHCDHRLPDDD